MKKKYGVFYIDIESSLNDGYGKLTLVGALRDTEQEAMTWLKAMRSGCFMVLPVYVK